MAEPIKIAVDAMGGDNSPKKIIQGISHHSKNSENSYSFFTEPTEVLFSSSKDKFEFNGKIENSVLAKEQEMIDVQLIKFEEIKLNLLSQQIKFSANNEKAKYDSINKEREKIEIKKTLFIVNYC